MLEPGLRAPDFVLPDRRGVRSQFYAHVGGRSVLLVFGKTLVTREDCDLVVVAASIESIADAWMAFQDADGRVAGQYGVRDDAAFLLDANLRVIRSFDLTNRDARDAIGQTLSDEVDSPSLEVRHIAPVLTVPRVLERAHREVLMTLWEEGGHVETGVESSREGGRVRGGGDR